MEYAIYILSIDLWKWEEKENDLKRLIMTDKSPENLKNLETARECIRVLLAAIDNLKVK